jgi:DNA-binding NarL/FixJ family response regulator
MISDDALLTHAFSAALSGRASLHVVSDLRQALTFLDSCQGAVGGAVGVVVDQLALRSDTVRGIQRLRAACPLAAVLFVAGRLEASLVNLLQPLRVQLAARPLPPTLFAQYVERALSGGRVTQRDLSEWIEHLAVERRLSAGDRALIPVVLGNESVEQACDRLGLDRAAIERGLRRMVKKCRVRNADRLARNLLRDALLFSRQETSEWIEPTSSWAASF